MSITDFSGSEFVISKENFMSLFDQELKLPQVTSVKILVDATLLMTGIFNNVFVNATNFYVGEQHETLASVDGVLFNKAQTELWAYPPGRMQTSYAVPKGVTSIYGFGLCKHLGEVKIPDSVKEIGPFAFKDCVNLASITLPKGIERIGAEAFSGCESLETLFIPASVTELGTESQSAFYGCCKLHSIDVDENNQFYASIDGVLFDKDKTKLLLYPCGKTQTSYALPEGVKGIGSYAFNFCAAKVKGIPPLASVTIPDSVEEIGKGAFQNCIYLVEATVGSGVKKIRSRAFASCLSFETIHFMGKYGDRIVFDENVFQGCEAVTIYCPQGDEGWERFVTSGMEGVERLVV
jgi:hypothetical protein